MTKVFEPMTDTIKNTSEDLAKAMMLTAKENDQVISHLNEKIVVLVNDNGPKAPYPSSFVANLFEPANKIQFNLIKDPNSIKMIDFLMKTSIPVNLYSNMLTFRDSNKPLILDGDLLETMTNFDFNGSQDQRKL